MKISHVYSLIVDFEATCSDDGSIPRDEMEIIEIGAVLQDCRTFQVVSEFQSFVRPVRYPVLTAFCTQLTSIRQSDVSASPTFPEVISAARKWADEFGDYVFCSWGDYDRKQLLQDCRYHSIAPPFGEEHINLKAVFAQVMGLKKRPGIRGALHRLGISFQGTPHRAIDDARNIARIVKRICSGE